VQTVMTEWIQVPESHQCHRDSDLFSD